MVISVKIAHIVATVHTLQAVKMEKIGHIVVTLETVKMANIVATVRKRGSFWQDCHSNVKIASILFCCIWHRTGGFVDTNL